MGGQMFGCLHRAFKKAFHSKGGDVMLLEAPVRAHKIIEELQRLHLINDDVSGRVFMYNVTNPKIGYMHNKDVYDIGMEPIGEEAKQDPYDQKPNDTEDDDDCLVWQDYATRAKWEGQDS